MEHTDDFHKAVEFYNHANENFVKWLADRLSFVTHGDVWQFLLSFKMMIKAKENYGIAITIGTEYYTTGHVCLHCCVLFLSWEETTVFLPGRGVLPQSFWCSPF